MFDALVVLVADLLLDALDNLCVVAPVLLGLLPTAGFPEK